MAGKRKMIRRSWAVGRAAVLMSLVPASALPARTLDRARNDGEEAGARDAEVVRDTHQRTEAQREHDLQDRLGVVYRGALADVAGSSAQDGIDARLRWRAPRTATYHIELWPEEEPPFKYRLAVYDPSDGGALIHRTEARGSSLVVARQQGQSLLLELGVVEAIASTECRIEIHEIA